MYFVHFIKQAAYTLNLWLRTNLYRDMLISVTLTPAWNTHEVSFYTSKLLIKKKLQVYFQCQFYDLIGFK